MSRRWGVGGTLGCRAESDAMPGRGDGVYYTDDAAMHRRIGSWIGCMWAGEGLGLGCSCMWVGDSWRVSSA